MTLVRRALMALALLAAWAPAALATDEVQAIPTRRGVTQPFVLVRPPGDPVASVILFAGGDGALGLRAGAIKGLGGNFLVRNRERFARHGLLVAVPDAPSDHKNLDRFRTSADHAADIRVLIAALRALAPAPVWLVGTSMGTVSAAGVAARLRAEGGPDGIVLTSTVTRYSREHGDSVDEVRVKDIAVPTLLVHNRDDACPASRYGDALLLLPDFAKTPRHELLTFEGGDPPQSPPCEAASAHGYLGLEAKVVKAIADWIKATPRP